MTNIFEVIGKHIEQRKKKKELFVNNYWKLSPIERIDYDNKIGIIDKETDYGIFPITFSLFKLLFFTALVHLYFYYMNLLDLLKLTTTLLSALITIVSIAWIIDYLLSIYYSNKRTKRIKELNKRFKL